MAVFVTTRNSAWSSGYTGYLYKRSLNRTTSAWSMTALDLPSNVATLNVRPSFATYRRRTYIAGMFSDILVIGEDQKVYKAGLHAHPAAPTVVGAAGGTVTGEARCYISFVHKIGNLDVSESNLSPVTVVTLASQARAWTLPTTSMDPHTTHVRGWVGMYGAIPRRAFETTLGSAAITEGVPTAELLEMPMFYNDGTLYVNDNGVPPYCKYIKAYHGRMIYAGDPQHPYRLWYSELDRPTAVGETDASYLDTTDGEAITGLGLHGESLVVFCNRATYLVRGWTDGSEGVAPDLGIDKVLDGIGCVSHHSIVRINERLWYAAEDGIRVYDGGFSYLMEDLRGYWKDDYKAYVDVYKDSEAIDDKDYTLYRLLIPDRDGSRYYCADYSDTDPTVGGSGLQPAWSFDTRARNDTAIGTVRDADGHIKSYTGSDDGYIRQENVLTDADDDNDTDNKAWEILLKHQTFGELAGDNDEGKELTRLFLQAESEDAQFTVAVYAGGEDAHNAYTPTWSQVEPAAGLTYDRGDGTDVIAVAESKFNYVPSGCAGEGFFVKLSGSAQTGFKFRGVGFEYGPGPCKRPYATLAP